MKITPVALVVLLCLTSLAVHADEPAAAETEQFVVEDLVVMAPVMAQKRTENQQVVPISISAFTMDMLEDSGATLIDDASYYVPGLLLNDLSSRKVAEPYIRGIGSSPINPGVSYMIDGVPQLNNQSGNIEFIDVERVEFLRGAQGTLYGRNTIGGVINVYSARPTEVWTVDSAVTFGNYHLVRVPTTISGPIVPDKAYLSVSAGYMSRDGYTKNTVTGNDLDDREVTFGKGQLLLTPSDQTEIHYIVWGEHAHDGDFALNDLFATRSNPYETSRSFEGYSKRDLVGHSLQIRHRGDAVDFTSITGLVWWNTDDLTDLDYTNAAFSMWSRQNDENYWQFTQEFRLNSAEDAPIVLSDRLDMDWQAGLFVFASQFDQDATTAFTIFPGPFTDAQGTDAQVDAVGVGVFGQTTLTLDERWALSAGLRFDWEQRQADIIATSLLAPANVTRDTEDSTHVSPRFALSYQASDDLMFYGSATQGYKAGGFNTNAPAGSEAFEEETAWTYELGAKSQWFDQRLTVNAALFYIDWSDVQISQFDSGNQFVANAGDASSRGIEIELMAKPMTGWDVFAGFAHTETEFDGGTTLVPTFNPLNPFGTASADGNNLPYAPNYQFHIGTQVTHQIQDGLNLFARGEVVGYGQYSYDASNLYDQDAYVLTNFRIGARSPGEKFAWSFEVWVHNAFETEYVPIAFPAPDQLTNPSGFIGEPGAPRTFGATFRMHF